MSAAAGRLAGRARSPAAPWERRAVDRVPSRSLAYDGFFRQKL
jgi:hypothetical protein